MALIVLNVHTQRTFRNFKPLVIRIDDVGHAAAVSYDSLTYTPQAPELKYFLVQFVTMHYGRMRATVRQQYAQSLYFLDGRLADATMEANKKSGLIERFLTSGGEEIDIRVKNVTLEDLRQPPYRATVDFEKVYLAPATRAELKREAFVAHLVFVLTRQVDNARIPINPLGLTITYFREDQAFVNGDDVDGRAHDAHDQQRSATMPFIPRQVKPPARQAITCKVPEETAILLKRYAEFLDSTQEYVVNEILVLAFRRDKEFQEWLATTGCGHAARRHGRQPRGAAGPSAHGHELRADPAVPAADCPSHSATRTSREIMVNGSGRVFVERSGQLEAVADVTVREQNLRVAVRNLARVLGDDISEERPLLDSRLPDGSRVAAALPPVSLGGTTLTIRKFQSRHFSADELVQIGTLTRCAARHACVAASRRATTS